MSDRAYLQVPFAEKDAAKALGARWDPLAKQWYAPPGVDMSGFARWIKGAAPASNPAAGLISSQPAPRGGQPAPAPLSRPMGSPAPASASWGAPRAEMGAPAGAQPVARGGPPELAGLAQSNPLTLSKALLRAQTAVLQAFPAPLWIQAEIDSVRKNNRSGHWYFELTERDASGKAMASMSARVWASDEGVIREFESQTGTELREGLRALFLMQIDFSAQYGLGAQIMRLDPSWTLGEMQKKLMQIRQALKEQGIAERNKSLAAPVDYSRVALIAPSQAAGLGDFMADARKIQRHGLCSFELFEATFEGRGAVETILRAFAEARRAHERNPFDALAIIRGGGASASLNWLNEFDLARAVALFPIPVLAGIGHERDKTAIDEVARVSLDTPSKVIGLIASTIVGNAQKAQADFDQAVGLARAGVMKATAQTEEAWAWVRSESMRSATRAQTVCQTLAAEIARESRFAVQLAEERAQALSKEVLGLGPRQTIARGYAMVREGGPSGRLISRASDAQKAQALCVAFADGEVMTVPRGALAAQQEPQAGDAAAKTVSARKKSAPAKSEAKAAPKKGQKAAKKAPAKAPAKTAKPAAAKPAAAKKGPKESVSPNPAPNASADPDPGAAS